MPEPIQTTQSTREIVTSIIRETYGRSDMADALARHLAEKIDSFVGEDNGRPVRSREDMIWRTCWDWFSGGTTAENVARKIEEAL